MGPNQTHGAKEHTPRTTAQGGSCVCESRRPTCGRSGRNSDGIATPTSHVGSRSLRSVHGWTRATDAARSSLGTRQRSPCKASITFAAADDSNVPVLPARTRQHWEGNKEGKRKGHTAVPLPRYPWRQRSKAEQTNAKGRNEGAEQSSTTTQQKQACTISRARRSQEEREGTPAVTDDHPRVETAQVWRLLPGSSRGVV